MALTKQFQWSISCWSICRKASSRQFFLQNARKCRSSLTEELLISFAALFRIVSSSLKQYIVDEPQMCTNGSSGKFLGLPMVVSLVRSCNLNMLIQGTLIYFAEWCNECELLNVFNYDFKENIFVFFRVMLYDFHKR